MNFSTSITSFMGFPKSRGFSITLLCISRKIGRFQKSFNLCFLHVDKEKVLAYTNIILILYDLRYIFYETV